ncbi:MAG: hypothetical protein AABY53_01900 [Bdellovibrionota bacterium]|mgnify:FL=1
MRATISSIFIFFMMGLKVFAQWTPLPNALINKVCAPAAQYPTIQGAEYCEAVITNWNSGVMDTKRNRLLVWGGGHNGYYGNEIYSINMSDGTASRLTDPGLPAANYANCLEAIAGGTQPNSRHTYDGIAYLAHADRFISVSGTVACGPARSSTAIWTYSFATQTWQQMNPIGDSLLMGWDPNTIEGTSISYDPISKFTFIDNKVGIMTYDLSTNTLKIRNDQQGGYRPFAVTSIIDPENRHLYVIGGGQMSRWDISSIIESNKTGLIPNPTRINSTGGSAIVGASHPGLTYDSFHKKIVGWSGGNTAYSYNPATNSWTAHTFTNGPGAADSQGTYKRFSYSATSNAFVVVNSIDRPAYTLRLSNTLPPPPPAALLAPKNLRIN